MADLHLEPQVFRRLSLVRFDLHIVQDCNLFFEVPLDVRALSFGYIFNSVLFAFELLDLFASKSDLLLQLQDLLLELIDGSFEAEWLLRAQSLVRRTHDCSSSTGQAILTPSGKGSQSVVHPYTQHKSQIKHP